MSSTAMSWLMGATLPRKHRPLNVWLNLVVPGWTEWLYGRYLVAALLLAGWTAAVFLGSATWMKACFYALAFLHGAYVFGQVELARRQAAQELEAQ